MHQTGCKRTTASKPINCCFKAGNVFSTIFHIRMLGQRELQLFFFFFHHPSWGSKKKKRIHMQKMNHLFLQDRALAQLTKKTALLKSPLVNQLVDEGCFQEDGYLKDSDITLRCTPSYMNTSTSCIPGVSQMTWRQFGRQSN